MRCPYILFIPLLTLACSREADPAPQGNTPPREAVVIAANGLVLREGPSAGTAKLALLAHGTSLRVLSNSTSQVRIDGITAPWLFCQTGSRRGWVFGGFVRTRQPGQSAPRGLALDRVPAILHSLFGKNPTDAVRRFGPPRSNTQGVYSAGGMAFTRHDLVYPGMTISYLEALGLETVSAVSVDQTAPPEIRTGLDIGQPLAVLSNLVNPASTSIRSNLVSRSVGRMEVRYTLEQGRITGFHYQNAFE